VTVTFVAFFVTFVWAWVVNKNQTDRQTDRPHPAHAFPTAERFVVVVSYT
jgi:hypothetical protein